MRRSLVLCIIDGFAFTDTVKGNAIKAAKTPNLDRIFSEYPLVTLGASGMSVGLPDGQMGNSEVGHTNIGAGRIVYQELTRITKSIEDGDFFENETLINAVDRAVKSGKAVHIMGLLSDGGVHSHIKHILALADLCNERGREKVFIHPFMDGRDTAPTDGVKYLEQLKEHLEKNGTGKVADICGRFYAMDRDNRWDRVEKAYDAITGIFDKTEQDYILRMERSYREGITDEFIVPFKCCPEGNISDGDSVIFANFRPDRAREITRALTEDNFDGFDRKKIVSDLCYVCMTQYDAEMKNVAVAFRPQKLENTFGEIISANGLNQLRIAETEKYAHVTFFFNGGVEKSYEGEDRALIPSPKVATYDLQPHMSAYEVTDELLKRLDSDIYDVVILNFANCDMVGHTGVFEAAVKAVETVDECIGRLYRKIIEKDGVLIITADHGNADKMLDENGEVFTAHTTNPVPFCVVNYPCKLRDGGVLADISPTMLQILRLPKPQRMTGKSLIEN